MKILAVICISCCAGISAKPVDNTKLIETKPEVAISNNKFVLRDEDFPALPQPEKPTLQRQSSVKDLIKLFEEKDSAPSSPALARKPSVTRTAATVAPFDNKASFEVKPAVKAEVSNPEPVKVVPTPAVSPAAVPSTKAPAVPELKPAVSPVAVPIAKAPAVQPIRPAVQPAVPAIPKESLSDFFDSETKKQKSAPKAPVVKDPFDDLIISDIDELTKGADAPKATPNNQTLVRSQPQPAAISDKTPLAQRPTLPKEVQAELIATVARKEAEKAAAAEKLKLSVQPAAKSGINTPGSTPEVVSTSRPSTIKPAASKSNIASTTVKTDKAVEPEKPLAGKVGSPAATAGVNSDVGKQEVKAAPVAVVSTAKPKKGTKVQKEDDKTKAEDKMEDKKTGFFSSIFG